MSEFFTITTEPTKLRTLLHGLYTIVRSDYEKDNIHIRASTIPEEIKNRLYKNIQADHMMFNKVNLGIKDECAQDMNAGKASVEYVIPDLLMSKIKLHTSLLEQNEQNKETIAKIESYDCADLEFNYVMKTQNKLNERIAPHMMHTEYSAAEIRAQRITQRENESNLNRSNRIRGNNREASRSRSPIGRNASVTTNVQIEDIASRATRAREQGTSRGNGMNR